MKTPPATTPSGEAVADDEDEGPSRPWRPSRPAPEPSSQDLCADMLDPDEILHPRSSDWAPCDKVAQYVASRIRRPFEAAARGCLRAECPRPSLEGKVAATPDIDPRMATFLQKFVKDPKKGIDRSWRACQDKLLDALGPITKILDMAEEAKVSGSIISPDNLSAWAQRAVVFLGNANCAISTERHRSLLIKVDPKLGDLADSEAGAVAQGGLFGEPFLRELGRFVNTFSCLDRAQSTIKRCFTFGSLGGLGEAGATRPAIQISSVDKARRAVSRSSPLRQLLPYQRATREEQRWKRWWRLQFSR